MYVSKSADTVVAKVIGTYPELPDCFDTMDEDPQWWRADYFFADGPHFSAYGGPLGVAVISVNDDGLMSVVKDGVVVFEVNCRAMAPEPRVTIPYMESSA